MIVIVVFLNSALPLIADFPYVISMLAAFDSLLMDNYHAYILTVELYTVAIAGFHSRDQQPCFSTKTKGSVCIIIELNSRRIWSGHQHGRLFFV